MRYLGLTYGYYPGVTNPEACWEIDSLVDSVADIMNSQYKFGFAASSHDAKEEAQIEYFTQVLPKWLEAL